MSKLGNAPAPGLVQAASTVLGGQIVAELNSAGALARGFVYLGGQLLAVQQNNQVSWVHQDPVVKSKRVTNASGNVISMVELGSVGRRHGKKQ